MFNFQNIVSPNPNFNSTLQQAHVLTEFLTQLGLTNAVVFATTNPSSQPPVQSVNIAESLDQETKHIPFLDTNDGSLQTNGVSVLAKCNLSIVCDGTDPHNVALIIHDDFLAHKGDPVSQLTAFMDDMKEGTSGNVLQVILEIAGVKAAAIAAIDSALGL
jgi:hypothetical protein